MTNVLYAARVPPPFSVNNMFPTRGNLRGRSAEYVRWRNAAGRELMAQGPRPRLKGPVAVHLQLDPETSSKRIDTDNCAKCYLDLMTHMQILPEDNRMIVRRLVIDWTGAAECTITIYGET